MVVTPEQKLVIKHTFLEYSCEEEQSDRKSLRQRSRTEPNIDEVVQVGEVSGGSNTDGSSIADKADQMPSSPSRRTPNSAHAASPDFMPATPEMSPLHYPYAGYMPMIMPEQCLPEAMGCNPWFQQGWWTPMAYNSEMSDTLGNFAGLGAPTENLRRLCQYASCDEARLHRTYCVTQGIKTANLLHVRRQGSTTRAWLSIIITIFDTEGAPFDEWNCVASAFLFGEEWNSHLEADSFWEAQLWSLARRLWMWPARL